MKQVLAAFKGKIALLLFSLFLFTSCDTYYRMVTTIDKKGHAFREIYAKGDSAFMAGNHSAHPFLFDVGEDWQLTFLDPVIEQDIFGNSIQMNTKISKHATSVADYSAEMNYLPAYASFVAPKESLTKSFDWFYNRYTYTAVFEKIGFQPPVPISTYLTDEELKLWTQGGFTGFESLNGVEMYEVLSRIESNFIEWFARNNFEVFLNVINQYSQAYSIVEADREKLYKQLQNTDDFDFEDICNVLDAYYQTKHFRQLYLSNTEAMDDAYEEAIQLVEQTIKVIQNEWVVPGKILSTNAPTFRGDTLIWKIDQMRLLYNDYTLQATYRTPNTWFIVVSLLVLIVLIASVWVWIRKRRL